MTKTNNKRPTKDKSTVTTSTASANAANADTANWGYENDIDGDIWRYSAFTESGAYTLAKTMKRLGCTIVEKPSQRKDGLWFFAFSNPLREIRDKS